MSTTVTIPKEEFDNLNSRVRYLEDVVRKVVEKIGLPEKEIAPRIGSDAWWEAEVQEGLEDITAGRYTTLKNPAELQQFLDSLK